MRRLIYSGIAFCLVAIAPVRAQTVKPLFFEADMVRGDQASAPGPFCVLTSQFKRLEKVVWRLRVLEADGKALDAKGLKSLVVELPDGQMLAAKFGPHPPPHRGPAKDHFWTARWIIPADYPAGTFAYKVVATRPDGSQQTWEPFKIKPSQLTVLASAIETKPGSK